MTNPVDCLEKKIRQHIVTEMPSPPVQFDGMELTELLHIYGNWRTRCPEPRPRRLHISRELKGELPAATEGPNIEIVFSKIERGEISSRT